MDSILIQSQFPHRVSLSQAAEISGYHQDYLGQLCRLGKIRASKIGRNWYTTQTELKVLLSGQGIDLEEIQEEEPQGYSPASYVPATPVQNNISNTTSIRQVTDIVRPQPAVVSDNYIISEVEGIPIQLRTEVPARAQHTVQTLITRMKLDSLKQEVLTIAQSVDTINDRLAKHEEMLEALTSRAAMRTDLRESFSPSLSVAPRVAVKPESLITIVDEVVVPDLPSKQWVWLWPALAAMALILPATLITFLPQVESPSVAQTIYYNQTQPEVSPQVAGDSEVVE